MARAFRSECDARLSKLNFLRVDTNKEKQTTTDAVFILNELIWIFGAGRSGRTSLQRGINSDRKGAEPAMGADATDAFKKKRDDIKVFKAFWRKHY